MKSSDLQYTPRMRRIDSLTAALLLLHFNTLSFLMNLVGFRWSVCLIYLLAVVSRVTTLQVGLCEIPSHLRLPCVPNAHISCTRHTDSIITK